MLVCLIKTVKAALGISGIAADVYSWLDTDAETGRRVQVDMVIERADNVVSMCEMKYAKRSFHSRAPVHSNSPQGS